MLLNVNHILINKMSMAQVYILHKGTVSRNPQSLPFSLDFEIRLGSIRCKTRKDICNNKVHRIKDDKAFQMLI